MTSTAKKLQALALLGIVKQAWKILPGINALAYFFPPLVTKKKRFIPLRPDAIVFDAAFEA
jgi:hypothetical protein